MNRNPYSSQYRGGYTLVELMIATGLASMLMVGLPSSLYIVSQSLNGNTVVMVRAKTADIQSNLMNDLKQATNFTELTSNAVTMIVPDRDNDGVTETIRYSWSGVAGEPLIYQYNGGAATSLVDDVHQFDLTTLTRTIIAPVIPDPNPI